MSELESFYILSVHDLLVHLRHIMLYRTLGLDFEGDSYSNRAKDRRMWTRDRVQVNYKCELRKISRIVEGKIPPEIAHLITFYQYIFFN